MRRLSRPLATPPSSASRLLSPRFIPAPRARRSGRKELPWSSVLTSAGPTWHPGSVTNRRPQVLGALGVALTLTAMYGELVDRGLLAIGAGLAGSALMFAAYHASRHGRI